MKKIILLTMISLLICGHTFVNAQAGRGNSYNRLYDTKTLQTITGKVVKIDTVKFNKGFNFGIQLSIKTGNDTLLVHAAPIWYLEQEKIRYTKGDTLEIKGSRITFENKPVIIAAEIKQGKDTLKLRDDNGRPSWAGKGRRK